MKKKLIAAAVVLAAAAWLVISNVFLKGYTGTFRLDGGGEWTKVSWTVRTGDADSFSAKLDGPGTLKVSYDGDYEFRAELTLSDASGAEAHYELRLYSDMDMESDSRVIRDELTRIDE